MKTALIVITVLCGLALLLPVPRNHSHQSGPAEIERAHAYLAENPVPMPPGWQWASYPYEGGQMRWGEARAAEDRGTLIFVPGFSNYIEAYGDFLTAWHEAGFTVIAVDLPGQGGSTRRADFPERPISGNFAWYADVLGGFMAERQSAATSPVTLVGESFGAHVTLRGAADGMIEADRIALIVPGLALQTPGMPTGVINGIMGGLTDLGYGHRYAPTQGQWTPKWDLSLEGYGCATRPDRIYNKDAIFALHPEFRIGGITMEWATGFDRSGRYLAETDVLKGVDADILMITAERDQILDYARTITACDEKLPHCTRIELPEAGHCLLLEEDAISAPMVAAVTEFAGKSRE
ncbi:alpha/beta hydrolase [Parvularcula marina]|uniref:Alpha/beta hydrolase n=1 Tax=Parvularcula marina TaxID=2292771 RepID=A0A371RK78_9PROT|nr:alpha/beta hydrolase [Parvularcula marina]RFB05844.1 alpha/beta hydrolase [Parvularcula marina]